MPKQLRKILFVVSGVGLPTSVAMIIFEKGWVKEIGLAGLVICLALLGIALAVNGIIELTTSKPTAPAKILHSDLPLIRMSFNNQEFVVMAWEDMDDHWLLKGHITKWGSYSGIDEISFRVPKGVAEVRLGYYMNHAYVLVDTSDPEDPGPKGYLSDTSRVWWDNFPFPKPMM